LVQVVSGTPCRADMVATGDLTVNEVTNTVQTPLQAQVVDGMILITGSSEIQCAEVRSRG
jgi:hypothetical protein